MGTRAERTIYAYCPGLKPSAWTSVLLALRNEESEARRQFEQTAAASEISPMIVLASNGKAVPTSEQIRTT
jgi:hypothetical protein